MSGDSGFHGRHCQTATYRGAHVRINELKFNKKRDISREIMKEMKIMREIRHPNINSFIGAHVDSDMGQIMLLTDFCSKGALMDILENRDIKLDMMFVSSLVNDLVTGMHFLHYNTQLQVHGNLRSSNCLITSRWTLQITDFGLQVKIHYFLKIVDFTDFFIRNFEPRQIPMIGPMMKTLTLVPSSYGKPPNYYAIQLPVLPKATSILSV